uniref:Uncharacterized protein n=1 Tax=Chlamydomonas leiostraca TaxID=1034604 RepID=A0A7S0RET5_9CHLO|mmetsp:Transcript_20265/g.51291  ORF Transcript_20265/g.51291 Transcript_20265/m.51291 type:complete len:195 (+) Transcript_20265:103-687(+)|eukprot:CAMPEP_0202865600 /NCGR_PEP_ID=MMETSP1391-20130828/6251_1 /ASSEMBLY_ACC=CAM_ASM_000867 /TAXON_ID=1034604 /ORGANISM="Chlamydomonas leiostraca, Strain SAG 11-49" /LENGTH=194 /DNA_ID=CAMNT_0049545459 /DNA_START=99 /DNA_END=683 /DNA_ORIENTATION=-
MKPEVFFTWASENASYIDNIKVKKVIKLFPVQFAATGFYNLHSRQFSHKLSCKDVMLRGKITYDPGARAVEYRKRFGVPFPVLGSKLGSFVASIRWAYNEVSSQWDPAFRFGFEFRQGGAEVVQLNAIRFKPKIFYKNIGVEARTQLTVQLPSKLLFDMAPSHAASGAQGGAGEDDDAFGCSLDVQQLNLVLRL